MFKLIVDPTFEADVEIPVAGKAPHVAKFTFKHRTKDELVEWRGTLADKKDPELFQEMVMAWDIGEPFNDANVRLLLQQRQGVAWNAYAVYLEELTKHREKNS